MSNLSILIHKDSSDEYPYTAHYDGVQLGEFSTLEDARNFMVTEFSDPKDPTRFIFHEPESGSSCDNQSEISSDLITVHLCSEGLILDFVAFQN